MTVKDLVALLNKQDQEREIVFRDFTSEGFIDKEITGLNIFYPDTLTISIGRDVNRDCDY